jgi:hypothetical protein
MSGVERPRLAAFERADQRPAGVVSASVPGNVVEGEAQGAVPRPAAELKRLRPHA